MNDTSIISRPYTLPVKTMLLVSMVTVYLAFAGWRYYMPSAPGQHTARVYITLLLWPVITIIETIIYWALRNRMKRDVSILMHLACTFGCFVVLNIVFEIVILNIDYFTASTIRTLVNVKSAIFWTLFIIGHVFFIAAMVKILRGREDDGDLNGQPPGVLDNIIDEDE
ncbi:MAG TPA: hypothetical protein VHB48_04805 [Chitinophagaceae bacterium]|jgi:hypothetical protein|nr:hypothetical protein [Chitinophagaceae bacterium]